MMIKHRYQEAEAIHHIIQGGILGHTLSTMMIGTPGNLKIITRVVKIGNPTIMTKVRSILKTKSRPIKINNHLPTPETIKMQDISSIISERKLEDTKFLVTWVMEHLDVHSNVNETRTFTQ